MSGNADFDGDTDESRGMKRAASRASSCAISVSGIGSARSIHHDHEYHALSRLTLGSRCNIRSIPCAFSTLRLPINIIIPNQLASLDQLRMTDDNDSGRPQSEIGRVMEFPIIGDR
jgi:hypothetical protein